MNTWSGTAPAGANLSDIPTEQKSCAQSKWSLLKVVEDLREPLGLKGTSISVLRAMLSFIRSDSIDAINDARHICFASNAALASRAHVSIQTVERHISKLVAIGLLARRSSGNGKRWARRDSNGIVVLATGLSLLPIAQRFAELQQRVCDHKKQLQHLALLRDKCTTALAQLKLVAHSCTALQDLQSRALRILRRKPDAAALDALLVDVSAEIKAHTNAKPNVLRGSDPDSEGHKEPDLTPLKEKEDKIPVSVSPETMEHAFPRLCGELRLARSPAQCAKQMDQMASQLALGQLWFKIKEMGPALSFMILGYLLERVEDIRVPQSYARKLYKDLNDGRTSWEVLTKPRKRRPMCIATP